MSERRSSADLGSDAEALLGTFPFAERDWESDARAIEARLAEAPATDERWLAAPLPAEPGEPSGVSATTTPVTNSGVRTQSLTELARRSVEKKQAEAREMARASLAIAAAQKPTAEEARALSEALAERAAAVSAAPPPAPPNVVRSVVASAPPPLASRASQAPNAWPKLALAVPLLALAAAALLWLRRPVDPAPLASNAPPASTIAPSEAKSSPLAATSTSTAAAPNAPSNPDRNAPSATQGIDPNTLPSEAEAAAKPAELAHAKALGASSTPARATSDKLATSEHPATGAAKPSSQASNEQSSDKTLPPDPALRPADSSGGELAAKPSTGAVQAALGAVMSGARHCVAGDDAPSSAVVSFGSDGRVQSVSVSGPAAGKASGACIQAQLTKARVQPFAASNFSVNATIRPD